MTFASRLLQIGVLAAAMTAAGAAFAADASPWSQGFHSRVRLIAGGEAGPERLAGIEIVLDDGFKTYWRNPGDAGLPPRFDWSGSSNAAAIDLRWPYPSRRDDAGGVTYGYGERVVLPVRVTPADPAKPVQLKLSLDYGVCKDICIPAHAELALDMTGDGAHRQAVEAAEAKVPRPQPLGAEGPLSVLGVAPAPGDKPTLAVRVRAPAGTTPSLFAEAPEGWFLSSSAPNGDSFTVTVEERPSDAPAAAPVRLTLVAGGRAVETELRLDANLLLR
jgi:DsbC/DsbD-like thiol-disulfide interchange protein